MLIIISLVFSIAYLTLLNSKVTNKLEGALWTLPAKLYSRPFELAEGSNVNIKNLIKEKIPDAIIDIKDTVGDGNHYSATIKSSLFKGKSKIEQHKIVYSSLQGKMGNELHALSIKTLEG